MFKLLENMRVKAVTSRETGKARYHPQIRDFGTMWFWMDIGPGCGGEYHDPEGYRTSDAAWDQARRVLQRRKGKDYVEYLYE